MRNYKMTLCAAICTLCVGCSDSLLDLTPECNNVINNYFTNEEQILQGVNAAYATLQYSGQYGIANYVLGELPSDNTWDEVPANDGGNYGQLDEFNMTSSNSVVADSWRHNYIGIQQCNVILNRIDAVEMEDVERNQVKGEMKFLRALMYFNLVRIFGDVPLVTKETVDTNEYFGQGRTKKEEVYKAIVDDLTDAIKLMQDENSIKERACKPAAQGLLGKVYLTLGDYASAIPQLEAVKQNPRYGLLDDPNMIFDTNNKGNKEILFDVQFESGLNGNSEGSDALRMFSPSGTINGAKGHNLPTEEVYALFANNDKRKTAYLKRTTVHLVSNKIKQTSEVVEDCGSNAVVLRYADVLLMLAECYAQRGLQDDMDLANDCLEAVRGRAIDNLSYTDYTDKDELLEEIATERRKELVCEGHRWFDLIRTGKAVEVMTAYFQKTTGYNGVTVNENNLVQPIPLSQIDTDSSIKQNLGYN